MQYFYGSIRHTTVGRTPVDEWPAFRSDLYLTTHNSHNRQTSIPPARFEPVTPASKRQPGHWVWPTWAVQAWNLITVCIGNFNVCAHSPFSCSSWGLHLGSPERCLALWIPTAAEPSWRKRRKWCKEESRTEPTPSRCGRPAWCLQTCWRSGRMASCVLYHLWKWCIISAWYLLPSLVV